MANTVRILPPHRTQVPVVQDTIALLVRLQRPLPPTYVQLGPSVLAAKALLWCARPVPSPIPLVSLLVPLVRRDTIAPSTTIALVRTIPCRHLALLVTTVQVGLKLRRSTLALLALLG